MIQPIVWYEEPCSGQLFRSGHTTGNFHDHAAVKLWMINGRLMVVNTVLASYTRYQVDEAHVVPLLQENASLQQPGNLVLQPGASVPMLKIHAARGLAPTTAEYLAVFDVAEKYILRCLNAH